jgi:TP901 family phage tail tape measure protein
MSDLRLLVDADTRQAEGKISKLASRPLKLNLKDAISQPLGRITGKVSEFNKSLEASNARVIAFGASAGAIFTIQKALSETVRAAIQVEKALQDINVVLNVSGKTLAKFGDSLFKIAKDTGQSFDAVAVAATELARQGLSVEQTLKRTSDALILSRLSGLSAAQSVETLTAAINSFSRASLTSTQIINKFANVDAAFAVSSADLAEAISRVGSTAQDVGVDIDQLIALVTAAQQTTARGGAVIGNSFKTIFTRLQRSDTLDALEEVGVAVRDLEGNALPATEILDKLATKFNTLSKAQQAAVAETVGGVFQINILRATLGDLGKEYGVYDGALKTSIGSTDQAIRRNEQLNTTLAALVNKTLVNANQASAEIGNLVFAPAVGKSLNALNSILDAFNQPQETEGTGTKIAKGILSGLGDYLSGPGLAVIGAVVVRLFAGLTTFGGNALKTLLGISSGTDKIAQAQARVNALLAQNPQLIQGILSKELSLLQVEQQILGVIQQQNAARGIAASIASRIAPKVPAPRAYGGFIPNFADAEIAGAKAEGYNAQRSFAVNNPVLGGVIVNNREKTNSVPVGGYPAGSFIVNPKQLNQVKGVPLMPIERMKNKGFIPNFADPISQNYPEKTNPSSKLSMIYAQKAEKSKFKGDAVFGGNVIPITFFGSGYRASKVRKPADVDLEKQLGDYIVKFTNNFAEKIFEPNEELKRAKKLRSVEELSNKGSFRSITGTVFESAVDLAAGKPNEGRGQNAGVDFATPNEFIKRLFNRMPGAYEAKVNADKDQLDSVAQKAIQNGLISSQLKEIITDLGGVYQTKKRAGGVKTTSLKAPSKAQGFIPNFAALEDAVKREKSAGIASSMIRVGASEKLISSNNPAGLGVYNTRDEPGGLNQGINRRRSKGFVPNFAKGRDVSNAIDSASGKLIALSLVLPLVSSILQKFGNSNSKASIALDGFTEGLSFALVGLILLSGPVGKALGLLAGVAVGVYSALEKYGQKLKEIQLESLKNEAAKAADALAALNGIVSSATPIINQLIEAQQSGSEVAEESLLSLADQINKLPLSVQKGAQEQLSAGNLSGLLKTFNDAAAAQNRAAQAATLAENIRKKNLTVSATERGRGAAQGAVIDIGGGVTTKNVGKDATPFANDIYKTFEDAASDSQDIISTIFSALNSKEREQANQLIQENKDNFSGILDVLTATANATGTSTKALDELRMALNSGATNGVKMSEALSKFSANAAKVIGLLKKQIDLLKVLPQTKLEGAGNILGGKESFMNPSQRFTTQSDLAAGASLYMEGKRREDIDTQGRGAYQMASTLVKSGNLTPEAAMSSGLVKPAVEARKQQIMEGGKQMEEIYRATLGKGEEADPEIIKQFQDMQDPLKAQELAQQSIKEYLMSDAQKTYAAFAPTLQSMLQALESLKGTGADDPQFIEKFSLLNKATYDKAEETRKQMGQTPEEFYNKTFPKMQAEAAKAGPTPESIMITEKLDEVVPARSAKPEENRLEEMAIPKGKSSAAEINAIIEASKTSAERMNEIIDGVGVSILGFRDALNQAGADLLNWVKGLFSFGQQSPAGVTPPTEDQMGGPVTASTNVQGNVTATVNLVSAGNINDEAKSKAFEAVIASLQEEVRQLKGRMGERVPPTQFSQQAVA